MRHVEHPRERHGVVGEVKDLLASRATAAHAVVGAILLAVAQRVDSRRGIGWPFPPAIHEVPGRKDLGDGIAGVPPPKARRRAVGSSLHRDGMDIAMRHACCSASLRRVRACTGGAVKRRAISVGQLVTGGRGRWWALRVARLWGLVEWLESLESGGRSRGGLPTGLQPAARAKDNTPTRFTITFLSTPPARESARLLTGKVDWVTVSMYHLWSMRSSAGWVQLVFRFASPPSQRPRRRDHTLPSSPSPAYPTPCRGLRARPPSSWRTPPVRRIRPVRSLRSFVPGQAPHSKGAAPCLHASPAKSGNVDSSPVALPPSHSWRSSPRRPSPCSPPLG